MRAGIARPIVRLPSQSRSLRPFFKRDWGQLFLEVVAKNAAHCCSTFALPHLGHLTLLSSCSVRVKTVENFFSQDLQRYSYWGMAPSSAPRFSLNNSLLDFAEAIRDERVCAWHRLPAWIGKISHQRRALPSLSLVGFAVRNKSGAARPPPCL